MYRKIYIWAVRPSLRWDEDWTGRDIILFAAIGGRLRVKLRWQKLYDHRLTRGVFGEEQLRRLYGSKNGELKRFRYYVYGVYKTMKEARITLENVGAQYHILTEELKND